MINKKKMYFWGVSILLLLLCAGFVWFYLVNVYEVKYNLSSNSLTATPGLLVRIEAIPVNSLGGHALFRKSHSKYYIEEGEDLVEIINSETGEDELILRSTGKAGKVVILIKSEFSLLPTKVEVKLSENVNETYS